MLKHQVNVMNSIQGVNILGMLSKVLISALKLIKVARKKDLRELYR